nr:hypothetical protein StreXyl84_79520 [Streptomyces sp. Xyl84]
MRYDMGRQFGSEGGRVSAGARMPVCVDVEFRWRHPNGWLREFPPRTGNGERVMVVEVAFRNAHRELAHQLASYAEQEGLLEGVGEHQYRAPASTDYSTLIGATVTLLGAAGGIGGVAAVLKVFFERNNGKKVTFGQDGEVLGVEGLSSDEIVRLLETLRDQRVEEENAGSSAQEERAREPEERDPEPEQSLRSPSPRRSFFQRLLAARRNQ